MKHLASLVLCVALAAATPVQAQDETRTERVKFPSGSTGTTISGSITGYEDVEYLVEAQAGQEMTVVLKSEHLSTYINVFEPGTKPGMDDAISDGSDDDSKLSWDQKDYDWLVKVNGKEFYLVFYEVIWGV